VSELVQEETGGNPTDEPPHDDDHAQFAQEKVQDEPDNNLNTDKMKRHKDPDLPEDEIDQTITSLMKGHHVPVRQRTNEERLAYHKLAKYKHTLKEVYDPVESQVKEHLILEARIVAKSSEVERIIGHFVSSTQDSGIRNLEHEIGQYFVGNYNFNLI
jgi:hypothetical protein